MAFDDVGPGVPTVRYHNNGRLIMLEVNCIKFSLGKQNSLGMIMGKFHALQSKTEGMAASVRVFLEHLRIKAETAKTRYNIISVWSLEETMTTSQSEFYANASLSAQVLCRKHYLSMYLGKYPTKL